MVKMHDKIVMMEIKKLVPYERNAKKHPDSQIDRLAMHIEGVGWDQPIVVDENLTILKGHGRRLAALKLGLDKVPVVKVAGLTEAQKKAVRLADNKLAESGWDEDLLKLDLDDLALAGWDVGELGFEAFENDSDGDGEGDGETKGAGSLAARFGIPPFSVLNAREGWWQDRKRAWLAIGIKSELGRGENALDDNATQRNATQRNATQRNATH